MAAAAPRHPPMHLVEVAHSGAVVARGAVGQQARRLARRVHVAKVGKPLVVRGLRPLGGQLGGLRAGGCSAHVLNRGSCLPVQLGSGGAGPRQGRQHDRRAPKPSHQA